MFKKVPAIILAAVVLDMVFGVASIAVLLARSGDSFGGPERWRLADSGVWVMNMGLLAVGFRDLGDRTWGRASRGARAASAIMIATVAYSLVWQAIFMFQIGPREPWFYDVSGYIFWGLHLAVLIALFVGGDRKGVAVGALVLGVLAKPPGFVLKLVVGSLGPHAYGAVTAVQGILYAVALGLLALALAAGVPANVPRLAARGFQRAANGFTLRIVAALGAMLLTLLAIGASSQSAYTLVKFVMMAGLVVNIIASVLVGIGALDVARSSLEGIAKPVAIIAGAAALWCAGVMFEQLSTYYRVLYGNGYDRSEQLEALAIVLPIIGALGSAVLATVIAGFARARGNDELAGNARGSGIAYLLLTLAAIGMQSYLLKNARSQGSVLAMMLGAAIAGLVAQVILSRLCRRGAQLVDAEPGLPPARVNA